MNDCVGKRLQSYEVEDEKVLPKRHVRSVGLLVVLETTLN
jgi:hypothetical protein